MHAVNLRLVPAVPQASRYMGDEAYREATKARSAERYARIKGTEAERERMRKRYLADPAGFKDRSTKSKLKKLGLTPADYARILVAQNGVCAICRRHDVVPGKRLAVDHCHATGKVRGLLCYLCNTSIGKMGDDPARLRAAAEYLERS